MAFTSDPSAVAAPAKPAKWQGDLKLKTHRRTIHPGSKTYTEALDRGLALAYRRYTHTIDGWVGTWTARRWVSGTKYEFQPLGMADDLRDADGDKVLTFRQAAEQAVAWFTLRQRETASGGVYRLSDAAADWLAAWTGSEAGKAVAEANVKHWILPTLGGTPINQLQTEDIQRWLEDMANKPPTGVSKMSPGCTVDAD